MNNFKMQSEIEALIADKAFSEKLAMAGSLEGVAQLFTDAGYPVTAQELENAMASVSEGKELSENDLEGVSGGGWLAAGIIAYVGYKLIRGYIDGVRNSWGKC